MKCDIIIPIWDQLEFTRDCVKSIVENTKYPFRLILIDNGSAQKTQIYLRSLLNQPNPEVRLIRNEENLGFVKAVNQGLKASDAPYICVMNNDTVAADGWLAEMIDVADSNQAIGLINPSSNNLGQNPPATDSAAIKKFAEGLRKFKGHYIELGAALGFCMLIKRDVFKKLGYFDEAYGIGNFEDTDYSRKAVSSGYLCVRAKASYVYHRISKSFLKNKDFEEVFRKNEELFNRRWGKPRRILYIMTREHEKLGSWLKSEFIKKARFGNWVWLFLKGRAGFEIEEHSNVRVFSLPEFLFSENCIFRILKRKKKFDAIYVDDAAMQERLAKLKKYHNADVMMMGG